MSDTDEFFRNVHPAHCQNGAVSSSAFVPSPEHDFRLSLHDGTKVTVSRSFHHYTEVLKLRSAGIWSLTRGEVASVHLEVLDDPVEDTEFHASISFAHIDARKARERKGKELKAFAIQRGIRYPLVEET